MIISIRKGRINNEVSMSFAKMIILFPCNIIHFSGYVFVTRFTIIFTLEISLEVEFFLF